MANFFARPSTRLLPWGELAVAIVLLSGIGVLFQRYTSAEAEATRWVEHTHDVIEDLLGTSAALASAESAQRDDETFAKRDEPMLAYIRSALGAAAAGGKRARALTADNSIQQERLARFETRLDRGIELLDKRSAALAAGHDPGRSPEAVRLSRELRDIVDEMIGTERVLQNARGVTRARETDRLRLIVAGALVGAFLLVVAAMALVVRQTQVRRRAEYEARAQHILLESIIEGTNDAVFAKDLAGRYLLINTAGARLLGLTPADMIGKDDGEIISPETAAAIMQRDRDILRSGVMGTFEQVATSKGVRRTFLTTKGPHRDPTGRIVGLIGISRDITERHDAAESRLGNMNLQLRLSELLQACRAVDEAYEVIAQAAPRFFSGQLGALYMFHASRDHLEAHVSWGDDGTLAREHPFGPDDCWALRRGQPYLFAHSGGLALACKHLPEPVAVAALCVPMLAHGEVLGILHLRSVQSIDEPVSKLAAVVAEQIGMALANLQLREKLRDQSIRDPLTGLFNRRYAEETLTRELHRAARGVQSLAVLAIDVDHFKRFNDTFGHEVGDQVLRELGDLLGRSIRGGDVASRTGGEELLIILPEAQLDGAQSRAEQIRLGVSRIEIKHQDRPVGPITVSIGVAAFPDHGRSPEDLLRAADAALYRAKHQGRNRVVRAETGALAS